MSDFRARMFEEHSQLSQRIDKLKEFVLSEKYDTLPEIDRTDLKKQLGHMERYFDVLSNRVSRQWFEEHSQLIKRIDKLKEFVLSEKYDTLPEIDRTDLKKQLGHMERYFDVLSNRVLRQCNNA